MKRAVAVMVLLMITLSLSGCYQIESRDQNDYAAFYQKMETVLPATYSMLPPPDAMESIDDIYLYYSDYDLLDSYYTIYLECSFAPEAYETEKQRVLEDAEQYLYACYNDNSFHYDSVYINQVVEREEDGFLAIMVCYTLFDEENGKIIYVDTFEEGRKSDWRTTYIPEQYLPAELADQIS